MILLSFVKIITPFVYLINNVSLIYFSFFWPIKVLLLFIF